MAAAQVLAPWPPNLIADAPCAVELELLVDATGAVESIDVLSGATPCLAPALMLAGELQLPPVVEDGVAVAVIVPLSLRFEPPPPELEAGVVGVYQLQPGDLQHYSLDARDAAVLPGTLGDPLRAAQNLPGTVRSPLDAGWFIVRGGNPRDTGLFLDGIRVYQLQHMGGFSSVIHPGWAERVDYWPGGVPARYGDLSAGAVDLITRPTLARQVQVGANVVMADALLTVPVGPAAIGASVRRSYLDQLGALWLGAESAAVLPRFYDWQARADWHEHSVFVSGFGDTVTGSSPSGYTADLRTRGLQVHGRVRLGPTVTLQPFYIRDEEGIISLEAEIDRSLISSYGGLRLERTDPEAGAWGWSLGLEGRLGVASVTDSAFTRALNVAIPAPYGSVRIGDDTAVILGLRLDSLLVEHQLPRLGPSPRIELRVPLSPGLTGTADLGWLHQSPPMQLVVGIPEGADLRLERAWSGGTGLRAEAGPWSWSGGLFYRQMENLSFFEPDGSLVQTRGRAAGIETLTRWSVERLAYQQSLSWSRSLREVNGAWEPSTIDQPITLNSIFTFAPRPALRLAARFRYSSGVMPSVEGDVVDVLTGAEAPISLDHRTPPYHALDLKISFERPHWTGYLDVQNVYNHRVPEPLLTPMAEAFSVYLYSLPTLPILGIESRF